MQHIASLKLIHRDLAARNILLTDSYIAKISDFGLCCPLDKDNLFCTSDSNVRLPIRWLSIEAIQSRKFSEKSDVWAFGVLIYEIYSGGKVPYSTIEQDEILTFLESGSRLEKPQDIPNEIAEIMMACWENDPSERPSFQELTTIFCEHVERKSLTYNYVKAGDF